MKALAAWLRLRAFSPDNNQGSAIIAGELMRMIPVVSVSSASIAADILAWLVDARPKEPTQRWRERMAELEDVLDSTTLRDICSEIGHHPEYARHKGTGWSDELFWFMWKTSAWYFGQVPQRILS